MCGFVCVVSRNGSVQDILTQRGDNKHLLMHRGPDFTDSCQDDYFFARHWRLSIIDLSANSNQPFRANDNQNILVYNGEIYNYNEIANKLHFRVRGDADLLFQSLLSGKQQECIAMARGFYSFIYYDANNCEVIGFRDRFGKKPLFYFLNDNFAVFASEESAILHFNKTDINPLALGEYFLYKTNHYGTSYFKEVQQIAPGDDFKLDINNWQFTKSSWDTYYNYNVLPFLTEQNASAITENNNLAQVLKQSISRRLVSDVKIGFALSGGVDSSLLFGLLDQAALDTGFVTVYTVSFPGSMHDESEFAVTIASKRSQKVELVNLCLDDILSLMETCISCSNSPLDHPHNMAYFLLCQQVSKTHKILITGEGADELFMGYDHFSGLNALNSFAFREFLTPREEVIFGKNGFSVIRDLLNLGELRRQALSSGRAAVTYELKTHLLSLLVRNDKMGMAHGLEIRAPFLDEDVANYAFSLAENDLVKNHETKYPLKQLAASLFPTIDFKRPKVGFRVPFDEYLIKNKSSDAIQSYIHNAEIFLYQHFGIRAMQRYEPSDQPRLSWVLLNIGIFLDKFN